MITALGTATLDIILKTKEKEIKEGTKIEIDDFDFSLGGGALNASVTFQKLGFKPEVYFHLGKDFLGEIIKQKVKKLKLKYHIFYHQQATTFSLIVLPKDKERIIFVHRGKESDFKLNELKKVKINPYLYLTTGLTSPAVLLKFFKEIRSKIKYLAINPSKIYLQQRLAFKSLQYADFLFLNDEELRILKNDFKQDLMTLARKTFEELKIKSLIVTLGDHGSLVVFENKIFKAGIFKPRKIVDKTGAGDAYASAFFGRIILGKKLTENLVKEALTWGAANSASVIQKLGAQNGILRKFDYRKFKNLKINIV